MATIDDIISRAQQVRDNTIVGSNTAPLVGGVMTDTAEHLQVAESDINTLKTKVNTNTVKLNTTTQKAETALNLAEELSEEGRYIIEGNVTNNPDEVTLTSEDDKLQLKNRRYHASVGGVQGQMGYIILAKGQTFKQQVEAISEGNTTFEIRYDYDLGGGSVMIPENCTLKFEGGKISNGTLVGDGTEIVAGLVMIFGEDVTLDGSWKVENIYSRWFDSVTLDNLYALSAEDIVNNIYLTESIDVTASMAVDAIKSNTNLYVGEGVTLKNVGGQIKHLVTIDGKHDIKIVGGTWDGNRANYVESQNGHAILVRENSYNITIENATIKNPNGDGVYVMVDSTQANINVVGCKISNPCRSNITITKGGGLTIDGCVLSDNTDGLNPKAAFDVEPNSDDDVIKNITIRNCTIKDCYRGVLSASSSVDSYTENLSIEQCLFDVADIISYLLIGTSKTANAVVRDCVFKIGQIDYYSFAGNMIFYNNVVDGNGMFGTSNVVIDNCTFKNGTNLLNNQQEQKSITVRNSTIPSIDNSNASSTDWRADSFVVENSVVTGTIKCKGVKNISITKSVLNLSTDMRCVYVFGKCEVCSIIGNNISVTQTDPNAARRLIQIDRGSVKVEFKNNIITPLINHNCVHFDTGITGTIEYEGNRFVIPSDVTYTQKLVNFAANKALNFGDKSQRPDGLSIGIGFQYMQIDAQNGTFPIWASAINGTTVTWVKADGTNPA